MKLRPVQGSTFCNMMCYKSNKPRTNEYKEKIEENLHQMKRAKPYFIFELVFVFVFVFVFCDTMFHKHNKFM